MQEVYCQIRKEWVAAQPEELVRQALVRRMVDELGYPSSLITVEKSLQQLPHIEQSGLKLPLRRADILVFAKGILSRSVWSIGGKLRFYLIFLLEHNQTLQLN
jgi:hypothetical protein